MQVKVQPRLLGKDLFNMAATRFNLHEKECFGLRIESSNPRSNQWVDMESKVLDQVCAESPSHACIHPRGAKGSSRPP